MNILRASVKDVDDLAPVFDQYRQFYKQPSNVTAASTFLRERLANEQSVIFCARDDHDGQLIGFCQLYPAYSSIRLKPLWILNDLFVVPEARQRSVGRKLIEHATFFARESQAGGLTLKTSTDNLTAQRLYESLGWNRNDRYFSYDLTIA